MNGENGGRRVIELVLAVFSVVGGGAGVYAFTAAQQYGALRAQVDELRHKDEMRDQRTQAYAEAFYKLQSRIEQLEAKTERLHPGR
jgi:hypothetical protein